MKKGKAITGRAQGIVFGTRMKGFSIKSKKEPGVDQPKPKLKEFKPSKMGKRSIY